MNVEEFKSVLLPFLKRNSGEGTYLGALKHCYYFCCHSSSGIRGKEQVTMNALSI